MIGSCSTKRVAAHAQLQSCAVSHNKSSAFLPPTGIKQSDLSSSCHCTVCGTATMMFFQKSSCFGTTPERLHQTRRAKDRDSPTRWQWRRRRNSSSSTHRQKEHAVHPEGRVAGVERQPDGRQNSDKDAINVWKTLKVRLFWIDINNEVSQSLQID